RALATRPGFRPLSAHRARRRFQPTLSARGIPDGGARRVGPRGLLSLAVLANGAGGGEVTPRIKSGGKRGPSPSAKSVTSGDRLLRMLYLSDTNGHFTKSRRRFVRSARRSPAGSRKDPHLAV